MKNLKKILSVLLVCSMILTTNAITTLAAIKNNEEAKTETIVEDTTEESFDESSVVDEIASNFEESDYTEEIDDYEEALETDDTENIIEEVSEEKCDEEVTEEESTNEETAIEEIMVKPESKENLCGTRKYYTFRFTTDVSGYFKDEDVKTDEIEYRSDKLDAEHKIMIPIVYNVAPADYGATIDLGWELYKGDTQGDWISDEQLQDLIDTWTAEPDEDVEIKAHYSRISHSSVKQKPDKIRYFGGEEIDTISYESGPDTKVYSKGDKFDPTGLVVHVTYVGGGEEDIPYDKTTAEAFKFNPEIDHVFDDSDIGNKVQVGFGNSAYVVIGMMDDIYPESFTFIDYDPKTDSVYVTPNPDAATETASVRGIFEEMINTALANGATGFHEYNANGVNDSKNKYNKYTPATMNKEEALARFDKYIADGATGNLFIGPSFKKPEPTPDPKPNPTNYSSGSDNSGSDSSSTSGPINPPNKNLDVINSFNSIPQGNLYNDVHFYDSLKLIPENMIAPKINIIDDKGNTGFGQWLIGRERAEWYVLSGDLNANGTKGSAGFLKNTWCKLKWNGVENWYHFGNDAKMTIGWYREGDKIYFLQNDLNDKQYGRLLTGIQNVGGITYDFGRDGAAKNTTDFNVGGGYVAGSIIPGIGQRYISPVDQLSKLEYNYEFSNRMKDNNRQRPANQVIIEPLDKGKEDLVNAYAVGKLPSNQIPQAQVRPEAQDLLGGYNG